MLCVETMSGYSRSSLAILAAIHGQGFTGLTEQRVRRSLDQGIDADQGLLSRELTNEYSSSSATLVLA